MKIYEIYKKNHPLLHSFPPPSPLLSPPPPSLLSSSLSTSPSPPVEGRGRAGTGKEGTGRDIYIYKY